VTRRAWFIQPEHLFHKGPPPALGELLEVVDEDGPNMKMNSELDNGRVRMRHFGPTSTLAVACIVFSVSYRDAALAFSSDAPSPPSVEFGELYGAVQMSGLFSDQKTFADAIPDKQPSQIVADYEKQ